MQDKVKQIKSKAICFFSDGVSSVLLALKDVWMWVRERGVV